MPDPVVPFLVLVVGVLLALLLAGRLLRPLAAGGAAAVGVVVILAFLALPQYNGARLGFKAQRGATLAAADLDQRLDCLARSGHPNAGAFVAWLRRRIPPDARYAVQITPADGPCLAMGLLPRVDVALPRARYLIFFDLVPGDWRARFDSGRGVVRFAKDRGFAELAR